MKTPITDAARYAGLYVETLASMADRLKAKVDRLNEGHDGELVRRWLRDHAEFVRVYAVATRSKLLEHCPPEMATHFVEYADGLAVYAESLIGWLNACERPSWDKDQVGAIQKARNSMQEAAAQFGGVVLQVAATTGEESAQVVEEHERMCNELADRPALLERYRRAVAPQIARLKATAAKWSRLTGPLF